jgi:hypothetical protein
LFAPLKTPAQVTLARRSLAARPTNTTRAGWERLIETTLKPIAEYQRPSPDLIFSFID